MENFRSELQKLDYKTCEALEEVFKRLEQMDLGEDRASALFDTTKYCESAAPSTSPSTSTLSLWAGRPLPTTGAEHLSNGNAGILRRAQGGQQSPVEQKGKGSLDLDFSANTDRESRASQ